MIPIQFCGHLGADPELRVLQDGTTVLNLRIAAQSSFEKDAEAEWFDVSFWGKRAEKLQSFVRKGSYIFVYGTFSTRKWEKDGRTGTQLEVRMDNYKLLDKKQEDARPQQSPGPRQASPPRPNPFGQR